MNVQIHPRKLNGSLRVPTSKSLAHRAIICACLSKGTSILHDISWSKDVWATIDSMKTLGAHIQVQGNDCIITGISTFQSGLCPCNESGSTLRFLIPIVATQNVDVVFEGKASLFSRPMQIYQEIFEKQNRRFEKTDTSIRVQGPLHADTFIIPGNISSQFISGLFMAAPLLKKDSILKILPPFESSSYVDLTLDMLKRFHIQIEKIDDFTFKIPGNQSYQCCEYTVEGDYSQMAFFAVLGAISHDISIQNMNLDSLQGDKKILDWLSYTKKSNQLVFQKQELIAQEFDLSDCPDLGPIVCVLAAFSKGTSHIIHTQRLRYKECDRVQAMEMELKKWGVDIESDTDSITIRGKNQYHTNKVITMHAHNDHRIAMACTIFAYCCGSDSILEDADSIQKSYPNFFHDIDSL